MNDSQNTLSGPDSEVLTYHPPWFLRPSLLFGIWLAASGIVMPMLGMAAVILISPTRLAMVIGCVCGAALSGFLGSYYQNARAHFIPAKWHVLLSVLMGGAFLVVLQSHCVSYFRWQFFFMLLVSAAYGAFWGARIGASQRIKLGTDKIDEQGRIWIDRPVHWTTGVFAVVLLKASVVVAVYFLSFVGGKVQDRLAVGQPMSNLNCLRNTTLNEEWSVDEERRFVVTTFVRSDARSSNGTSLLDEDLARLLHWQGRLGEQPSVEFVVIDLAANPDEYCRDKYGADIQFVGATNAKLKTPTTYVFDVETMKTVACNLHGAEVDHVMQQAEEFLTK